MKDQNIIEAYNSITPDEKSRERVLAMVRKTVDKTPQKTGRQFWIPRTAAAVFVLMFVLAGTATAYAMWRYLSPSQVADKMGDKKLADSFLSEDAVQTKQKQQFKEYNVTLLGLISGKNLTSSKMEVNGEIREDRTYCVVAIEKADGSAMPDMDDTSADPPAFLVSPLIQGQNPRLVNIFVMGGGAISSVENGIFYRIIDCDNLSAFADRKIYLSVAEGTFMPAVEMVPSKETLPGNDLTDETAYIYYEDTGEVERNQNYSGVNALFTLPIDKSLADSDKADRLLKEWEDAASSDDKEEEGDEQTEEDNVFDQFVKPYMTEALHSRQGEKIQKEFTLIEDCVQTIKPDENGIFHYSWEKEGYGGSEFSGNKKDFFYPDELKPGSISTMGGYSSDGTNVIAELYQLNVDGSITVRPYYKKISEIVAQMQ